MSPTSREARRSRARPAARPRGTSKAALLVTAAAAGAAAVIAAAIHWTAATAPPVLTPRAAALSVAGKTLGEPSAPVSIEIFSDFLCSHCADLAETVEPALIEEFVTPGAARIVYRHFPVVAPLSVTAARASECAADQGRFWPYHDRLYTRAPRGALRARRDLEDAAREVGLDTAAFDACLRDPAIAARVDADRSDGARRGVEGTPTTFINNLMIVGAQPLEVFREAIRASRSR